MLLTPYAACTALSAGSVLAALSSAFDLTMHAVNLGVPPLRTFVRLTVPLMASGLIGGMILVWITAASELSSTIVLYTSRWQTMTVRMYHFLEGGEGAGSASAAAAILILFTAAPLLLIHRRMRRQDDPML